VNDLPTDIDRRLSIELFLPILRINVGDYK